MHSACQCAPCHGHPCTLHASAHPAMGIHALCMPVRTLPWASMHSACQCAPCHTHAPTFLAYSSSSALVLSTMPSNCPCTQEQAVTGFQGPDLDFDPGLCNHERTPPAISVRQQGATSPWRSAADKRQPCQKAGRLIKSKRSLKPQLCTPALKQVSCKGARHTSRPLMRALASPCTHARVPGIQTDL